MTMLNKKHRKFFKILIFIKLSFLICLYYESKGNELTKYDTNIENQFLTYLINEANNQNIQININKSIDNDDIFYILHKHKAFIIDKNNLENLNQINNSLSFTFGIYFKKYINLIQCLKQTNLIQLIEVNSQYFNITIPSAIYFKYKNVTFQISAIFDRGNFLWLPKDNFSTQYQKFFNDKPRALSKFKIIEMKTNETEKFYVPLNIKKFLYDYKHSQFIECNYDLAKHNFVSSGHKYCQNKTKNKQIAEKLSYLSQTLEQFSKDYWLAGGTLLGWYRDCGVIPYTTDIDIGLYSHQYDLIIKQHFRGNHLLPLILTFGYPNDSYELRLGSNGLWVDLFYFYDYNSTHQWCAYQDKRIKKRRFISKYDLCSAELLDFKYLVPCEPEKYLNEEYGYNLWKEPREKNYAWTNVIYWKNWSNSEWLNAVKFFDKEGNFLTNITKTYINMYL